LSGRTITLKCVIRPSSPTVIMSTPLILMPVDLAFELDDRAGFAPPGELILKALGTPIEIEIGGDGLREPIIFELVSEVLFNTPRRAWTSSLPREIPRAS